MNKMVERRNLMPASLSSEHFWMLIDISPVYSEKVIRALRDFLVMGREKRDICESHNVSSSYFSVTLGRVSRVNNIVSELIPYYSNKNENSDG